MKKKILKFVLILVLLMSFDRYRSQAVKTSDSREFFYNVSSGAIIGGIGAVINKKPEQKFDKVFFRISLL